MEAKETNYDLPNYSFLVDRQFFNFYSFNHTVCLLIFGYYDEKGKFCYIYHLLIDNYFMRAFTDYFIAVDYVSKLA